MPPGYSKWIEYKHHSKAHKDNEIENNAEEINGEYSGSMMISVIWLVWVCNIIIGTIMLLNFLIAIVSQAYHGVITRKDYYRYRHRCDSNMECLIYYEFFSRYLPCMSKMKSFNCLLIQAQFHGEDMS